MCDSQFIPDEYENGIYEEEDFDCFDDDLEIDLSYDVNEQSTMSTEELNWLTTNRQLSKSKNWHTIYKNTHQYEPVNQSFLWNFPEGLYIAAFAYSKCEQELPKPKQRTRQQNDLSQDYCSSFIKMIERAIALIPDKQKYWICKAYFYYCKYNQSATFGTDEMYNKAYEILKNYTEDLEHNFKYARWYIYLQHTYYTRKYHHNKDEESKHLCEKKFDWLSSKYMELVEEFDILPNGSIFNTEYNLCKYDFVKLTIDYRLNFKSILYWFFQKKYQRDVDNSFLDPADPKYGIRAKLIGYCTENLKHLETDFPLSESPESVQNDRKLNFIDVNYRLSMLYNIKGMLNVLANKDTEKNKQNFIAAKERMIKTLEYVKKLQQNNARFNMPWYIYCQIALSEFALGKVEDSLRWLFMIKTNIQSYNQQAKNYFGYLIPLLDDKYTSNNFHYKTQVSKQYITRNQIHSLNYPFDSLDESFKKAIDEPTKIGWTDLSIYFEHMYYTKGINKAELITNIRRLIPSILHYCIEELDLPLSSSERIFIAYNVCKVNKCKSRRDNDTYKNFFRDLFFNEIIHDIRRNITM